MAIQDVSAQMFTAEGPRWLLARGLLCFFPTVLPHWLLAHVKLSADSNTTIVRRPSPDQKSQMYFVESFDDTQLSLRHENLLKD